MRGHVDAEDLAMCREGLLGRRASARIRAHLSGCSHCAEVDAGIAEVPTLLALTSVPPMPAELATRIEAALAAEAASPQAEAAKPAVPVAPATAPARVRPPASRVRTSRSRPGVPQRILAYAAVVAVVAAGGGYLLSRLPSGSPGSSASSARAHGTAEGSAAQPGGRANAAEGSGLTVISSGTEYRSGQLPAQAAAVLAHYATPPTGAQVPAATKQAPSARALQPRNPSALAACVARIAAGQLPRLVDVSRYNGRPATIIVLPATAHAPAEVWVVGPACSAARSDVITHAPLPGSG